MARRARTKDSLVTRLGRAISKNADGLLALLIAAVVGTLTVIDLFGNDIVSPDVLSAAILAVLALLAFTLLRDRQAAKAQAEQGAAVRQVDAYDADQERLSACRTTKKWEFRGGIGDVLRAATLPTFVEANTAARLELRLEILDPDDPALRLAYAKYRALAATGAEKGRWTADRTRDEVLATIFAACWYRQQHRSLDIRVGLSAALHTIRWEAADDLLIISEEAKAGYALVVDAAKPYYDAFTSDMTTSFRRARELPIAATATLPLPAKLRGAEVKAVFDTLGIDVGGYDDRGLVEIARMALKENESVLSVLRARTVGGKDPAMTLRR